ncbi:hypothetical protein Taro_039862 [Colocasia esculenta]|uniref:Uncharacterized protein n=1 Tax=Colocasia esculenta TaxID=4460 RepID=A0A843WH02_COLES|nr:hypothetical protein [Colocasia esculenta]
MNFCTLSHRALGCESSYSLCGLSRRAQFGVVILRLLFEPSCSVWSRRAPGFSEAVAADKAVAAAVADKAVADKVADGLDKDHWGWGYM